jgi:hypothetical protein
VKLVAVTALWRRLPLAKLMIERLTRQGVQVVAAGSEGEASRSVALAAGADYIEVTNNPLGAKWNAAARFAKEHKPDGIVILGSDDFVSDGLVAAWQRELDSHAYTGLLDILFFQPASGGLVHWHGYRDERQGETIGASRCLRSDVLDRIGWRPWPDTVERGLDRAMTARLCEHECASPWTSTMTDDAWHVDVKTAVGICSYDNFLRGATTVSAPQAKLDRLFGAGFHAAVVEADLVVRDEESRRPPDAVEHRPRRHRYAPGPRIVCAWCNEPMVAVDSPSGHEDHQHVRCTTCSPPWWRGCVTILMEPM